uniref:Uncharacterized protein n=1 Tax=Octopus bimaculoides TaxID=37653 RepID=A0A0L8I111_OCTBM
MPTHKHPRTHKYSEKHARLHQCTHTRSTLPLSPSHTHIHVTHTRANILLLAHDFIPTPTHIYSHGLIITKTLIAVHTDALVRIYTHTHARRHFSPLYAPMHKHVHIHPHPLTNLHSFYFFRLNQTPATNLLVDIHKHNHTHIDTATHTHRYTDHVRTLLSTKTASPISFYIRSLQQFK